MDPSDLKGASREAMERMFYQAGQQARDLANFFHFAVTHVDDPSHLERAERVRGALHQAFGTRPDLVTKEPIGPLEIMAGMHQFLVDIRFNPADPDKEPVKP